MYGDRLRLRRFAPVLLFSFPASPCAVPEKAARDGGGGKRRGVAEQAGQHTKCFAGSRQWSATSIMEHEQEKKRGRWGVHVEGTSLVGNMA